MVDIVSTWPYFIVIGSAEPPFEETKMQINLNDIVVIAYGPHGTQNLRVEGFTKTGKLIARRFNKSDEYWYGMTTKINQDAVIRINTNDPNWLMSRPLGGWIKRDGETVRAEGELPVLN